MANIFVVNVKSWEELITFINVNFTYFNKFIFRGHSEAEWKLESNLTRVVNKVYKVKSQKENATKLHLANFKTNLRGRTKIDLNTISENEVWAIGQHFGLLSPLLDWTGSPFVGLFFALQNVSHSKHRCLWACADEIILDINKLEADSKNHVEIIRPLSNENPRLVSQQGLFLKIPFDFSIEELVEKVKYNDHRLMICKIIFPDSITKQGLAALNNMNINKLTLFPDIMGSALHTNYILEIEPYLQSQRDSVWEAYNKSKASK